MNKGAYTTKDMTMDDKFSYATNDDTMRYFFFRLKFLAETF